MYLEETEQSDGAEQGPRLTEVAGLTEGNASAALGGNVLAELSEQRLEDCGGDSERSDQYLGTGNILKCITSRDKTLRSSYPLERWDASPSWTSEPCVRHRSAPDGCPCRTEQRQHVAHQHQDSDLVVDELDANTFERCETCGCASESREQLELPQQYVPSATRNLQHKPEASVEDPERHELPVFVRGAFESADESDCDAELSEYAGIQNHRMVAEDNDEWGYLSDDSQERVSDDELGTVSEDMNWRHPSALLRVNFDKSEGHVVAARESVNETGLTLERNTSDKPSEGFLTEDDVSSDGSSSESFKTCAEDSENSLISSESESEKETPEDWSDDQTRWESCEDDEEPRNLSGTVHDEKKTSNFVLEDYFDLFDRVDYHGPTLTQSQRYISCFDGGDIHDCLYGDQLQAEKQPQNARRLTETKPHRNDSSEKTFEGIRGCDSNWRGASVARPEDCKAQHELDDVCEESNVNEAKTCDAAEPLNKPQIKSLPTSSERLPNSVVLNAQMIDAPNEGRWVASESETQFGHAACPQESQVGDVNEHCSARGESKASNEDSASIEISREVRADIIHSVVSEYDKTEEGVSPGQTGTTEDLDDEDCDGDPDQLCHCDYCIPPSTQVPTKALLPQLESHDTGKICVVIDLDETLVHSSFTPVNHADFITPVDIDGMVYQVYVSKRPHVDEFLRRMGEMFECVLFTASLSKYADPVSDILDKWGAFRSRLFREACVFHKGNYVKDLSHLGRDLNKVIIIDNSPVSYTFHPDNAVPVASWFDDMSDSELLDLIPFFERLNNVDDVYDVLKEQRALG